MVRFEKSFLEKAYSNDDELKEADSKYYDSKDTGWSEFFVLLYWSQDFVPQFCPLSLKISRFDLISQNQN
jgi:hypothetical protein